MTDITPPASDQCANCQAPLASDQRYCVNCGERRGKPRQSFQASTTSAPTPAPPKRERRARVSSGTTLIAGVATLLLAMGVGVLIGQNGTSDAKQPSAPAAQVVTVNGGSGSGAGGSSPTATASKSSKSKHGSKQGAGKQSKAPVAHLSKKTTAAVNQGAANVVGSNQKLAPATVKVGGNCQTGEAGCQNGKFTGGFFGGG